MPLELRSWIGLAAVVAVVSSVAWAQSPAADEAPAEPPALQPPPPDPELVRHRCRLFPTELDATVDTWDRSSAVGQWVLAQQEAGWRVEDVEMSVGRKATGFAQAWAQVCMVPRVTRPANVDHPGEGQPTR